MLFFNSEDKEEDWEIVPAQPGLKCESVSKHKTKAKPNETIKKKNLKCNYGKVRRHKNNSSSQATENMIDSNETKCYIGENATNKIKRHIKSQGGKCASVIEIWKEQKSSACLKRAVHAPNAQHKAVN